MAEPVSTVDAIENDVHNDVLESNNTNWAELRHIITIHQNNVRKHLIEVFSLRSWRIKGEGGVGNREKKKSGRRGTGEKEGVPAQKNYTSEGILTLTKQKLSSTK